MTAESERAPERPTYQQAIAAAGHAFAVALAEQAARTPYEAALAAHCPGGPSVDELEARIRTDRGLPPKTRENGTEAGAA